MTLHGTIPVLPPFQWSEFILENPDEAQIVGGDVNSISDPMSDLQTVNAEVNTGIVSDREGWAARRSTPGDYQDRWKLWPESGWCGDYSVTKRHELLTRGWPSGALLLVECITAMGEDHAVLVVCLANNDLVLDNLVGVLRSPEHTGYKWVKVQSADDPKLWFGVGK